MITLDMEQKTQEWYRARLGIPTASCFDKIVTSKGEPSKSAVKYMYQLAGERLAGIAEEGFQSLAMKLGNEREAEARYFYEMVKGAEIRQVGFCLSDYKSYGCSPDGLVGEEGLIQIKCPNMATHIGYLIEEKLPSDYFQQVQGELLVTGRKWSDFMSYYPGLKPLIVRVERDEPFLLSLNNALEKFCKELEKIVEKIK